MVEGLSFFNHQILAPFIESLVNKIPIPTQKKTNELLVKIHRTKNRAPLEGVELALLDHFQLDLSEMESEAKELAQVPSLAARSWSFVLVEKIVMDEGEMVKEIQAHFFKGFLGHFKGSQVDV